ncbi:4-diphosphocytidyl-2-C-methyl-D-erythritol kinase IspE [Gottschalkia purinilytica]|uniref:4-diphosphocytidyl-2-C-methyl-D-erythritol kinase n=1 Tax=Gottschalkia purinilytica TaxID=1503 RepID=A0A0L0WED3_GOTPU|nr:4-(cytidine 5'-diphospho)-2-C-methyl-D-erythritol kinase [Gottschalkia purinilytica]KNF09785.1 4-diphosphocytidyl-2-C-methyl-D-erythritol kinase IspE [Gottschalkia purinilytica]
MGIITMNAYAKINLSLDVIKRREDGYHELKMIMQQIDLKDTLTIEETDKNIEIVTDNEKLPIDSSNVVYKVWYTLSNEFNIKKGVRININKNIPISAGLAGGSTDAAAVLKGLNELWNLGLTERELMDIGVKIGADVPYCIMGGTALAEGIGEKLTKLKSFSNKLILLANPGIEVSTAYVYNSLDLKNIKIRPDTSKLIESIEKEDTNYLAKNMVNVLESVTIKDYPIINEIKKDMIENGAIGSIMSGSGSTVFGIFENENDLEKCKEKLNKKVNTVITSKTI